MKEYIELRQTRPFGDKISGTFEFIKINFRNLFAAIVYIAGPAILLSSAAYVLYMNDISNIMINIQSGIDSFSPEFFINIGIYMVLFLLSYVLLVSTVLEYINIYIEKKSNEITVSEVWQRVKVSFVQLLLAYILLFLLFSVVTVIISMIFAALVQVAALAVIGVFAMMFFFMYILITISIYSNIQINEKRKASQAFEIIARCFQLIRGKWWSTFGIIIVSGIIVYVLSSVLALPMGASKLTEIFKAIQEGAEPAAISDLYNYSITELVFTGISFMGQQVFSSISVIAVSFQYFNLVERREAQGLFNQINSINDEKDDGSETNIQSDEEEQDHY